MAAGLGAESEPQASGGEVDDLQIEQSAASAADFVIWRYLSLEKFLSLLVRGELYFSRLDKLDDILEGHCTVVPPNGEC